MKYWPSWYFWLLLQSFKKYIQYLARIWLKIPLSNHIYLVIFLFYKEISCLWMKREKWSYLLFVQISTSSDFRKSIRNWDFKTLKNSSVDKNDGKFINYHLWMFQKTCLKLDWNDGLELCYFCIIWEKFSIALQRSFKFQSCSESVFAIARSFRMNVPLSVLALFHFFFGIVI